MLWIGIDTHLKMHEVEIQNENGVTDPVLQGKCRGNSKDKGIKD